MNLASKKTVRCLLKKYQARPSKKLGQNFLIDKRAIKKIIKASNLKPKEIVLEIGPGIGTLTQGLAKKAKKVIAVEKDRKMIETLKETLKDFSNIKIIYGDILKIGNWKLIENWKLGIGNSFKVIGNLPFYLTAPVIKKFLESKNSPKEIILIVQKEVGQRICAKPPKMNILATSVQFYAKPEIISYVSKKSFWPSPKVDSAILRITPIHTDKKKDAHKFFRIIKAGFSQPRKQLINNLSIGLKFNRGRVKDWLLKNNIRPDQRAETLTIEDWVMLTKSFHFVVK